MDKYNTRCAVCKKGIHRKPSEIKRNITGYFFCSSECDAIMRSEKKLERSFKKITDRIGTEDLNGWLQQKYVVEGMNTLNLSILMYGVKRNDTSVCDWLRRFDIPLRDNGIKPGKGHWKYDDEKTDEERILNRRYPEYRRWRNSVFERDGFTCHKCGQVGGKLNAHHLDGYDKHKEKRLDVSNGITLCESCHIDFHAIYGKGNNTKGQYLEFSKTK